MFFYSKKKKSSIRKFLKKHSVLDITKGERVTETSIFGFEKKSVNLKKVLIFQDESDLILVNYYKMYELQAQGSGQTATASSIAENVDPKWMVINKATGKLSYSINDMKIVEEPRLFSCVLGFTRKEHVNFEQENQNFLILAQEVYPKVVFKGHFVYQVSKVVVISTRTGKKNSKLTTIFKKFFESGFIFSFTKDLTKSLIKTQKSTPSLTPQISTPSYYYWWNRFITAKEYEPDWTVFLVNGNISFSVFKVRGLFGSMCIFSKRSLIRGLEGGSMNSSAPKKGSIEDGRGDLVSNHGPNLGLIKNYSSHEIVVRIGPKGSKRMASFRYSSGDSNQLHQAENQDFDWMVKNQFKVSSSALKNSVIWLDSVTTGRVNLIYVFDHSSRFHSKFVEALKDDVEGGKFGADEASYSKETSIKFCDYIRLKSKSSTKNTVQREVYDTLFKVEGIFGLQEVAKSVYYQEKRSEDYLHFFKGMLKKNPYACHITLFRAILNRIEAQNMRYEVEIKDIENYKKLKKVMKEHFETLFQVTKLPASLYAKKPDFKFLALSQKFNCSDDLYIENLFYCYPRSMKQRTRRSNLSKGMAYGGGSRSISPRNDQGRVILKTEYFDDFEAPSELSGSKFSIFASQASSQQDEEYRGELQRIKSSSTIKKSYNTSRSPRRPKNGNNDKKDKEMSLLDRQLNTLSNPNPRSTKRKKDSRRDYFRLSTTQLAQLGLKNGLADFSFSYKKLKIHAISWNVGGHTPAYHMQRELDKAQIEIERVSQKATKTLEGIIEKTKVYDSLLLKNRELREEYRPLFKGLDEMVARYEKLPDMIVVNLQEIIDLKNIFFNERDVDEVLNTWRALLEHILIEDAELSRQRYQFVWRASMVGLGTLVFASGALAPNITHRETKRHMLGLNGIHGNKGSISVVLRVFHSTINLTNLHLFSGRREIERRREGLMSIEQNLKDCDFTFLAGDFNSRVQIGLEEYRKLLSLDNFREGSIRIDWVALGMRDEIRLGCHPMLVNVYKEHHLCPFPTYKVKFVARNDQSAADELEVSEVPTGGAKTGTVSPKTPKHSSSGFVEAEGGNFQKLMASGNPFNLSICEEDEGEEKVEEDVKESKVQLRDSLLNKELFYSPNLPRRNIKRISMRADQFLGKNGYLRSSSIPLTLSNMMSNGRNYKTTNFSKKGFSSAVDPNNDLLGLFEAKYKATRVCSWTDRIFVKGRDKFSTKLEGRLGSVLSIQKSDHRPVYGTFILDVKIRSTT